MRLGILGLPKVGKTTLFNLLTRGDESTDKFSVSKSTHVGIASVPDPRLERLRELYRPRKYIPARVEYVDIPGIEKGDGSESLDLPKLREVDALLAVVRSFEDPELPPALDAVDPEAELATLDLELILADHGLVERRLERLIKAAKSGLDARQKQERDLLEQTVLPALDAERPVRDLDLSDDQERLLRGFQLLSSKPRLIVLNVSEDRLESIESKAAGEESESRLLVSAPIEEEISRLAADEQEEFLAAHGLAEPSVARILRESYEALGLISFFTVGEDEVRAWTLRRGTHARRAAATIHSDIERGFIRAEVVDWADLVRLESLPACREAGLLRLEGKEYTVADGEVVHFRFNV